MTIVQGPTKAQALRQEVATLLEKNAIEELDLQTEQGGYYSGYFLVTIKDGGFRPILDTPYTGLTPM